MTSFRPRFLVYLLLLALLLFMPYSTFVLQALRFAFQEAGHPLPLLLQKAMIGWKELLLAAMALLLIWVAVRERKVPFQVTALDRYLAAFAILGTVIGYLLTRHLSWTVFGFRYDFSPFLYYFAARSVILSREQLLALMRRLVWWSVPCLVFGLLQTLVLPRDFLVRFGYDALGTGITGNPLPPYHLVSDSISLVRAMSTFPGPNSLALYAVIILLVVAIMGRPLFAPAWRWALGALAAVSLVLTFSRGHLIGFVSGLLVIGLLSFGFSRLAKTGGFKQAAGMLVIGILSLSFVATVIVGSYQTGGKHAGLLSLVLHDTSSAIHRDVRLEAWQQIKAHPWGSGLGTSGLATTNTGVTVSNPESWYVQIAVEFGWLGLAAALGLILVVMGQLSDMVQKAEDRRIAYFFIAGFTAVAVGSNFLPSWFEVGSLYWWILFGLFLTGYQKTTKRH